MLNNKNKVKCKCLHTGKLNFVARAGCAEDDAAVAALPDTWKPIHGGRTLANYLKEQEQNYKNVLKHIVDEAVVLNSVVDAKIRALAEMLLAQLKQNESEVDCVIERSCVNQDSLSKDNRDEALKSIKIIIQQRIQYLEAFKREAAILERERADCLCDLLRNQFRQLIVVGYLPPKDLLHDFDERMYQINQQLMSNSRAYIELEAKLRAQTDESIVRARSCLNQLGLGVGLGLTNDCRNAASSFNDEKIPQMRPINTIKSKSELSKPLIGNILGNVEEFNECVSRLVQAYRTAILKIFTDFSGNLNVLQRNLNTFNAFVDNGLYNYEIVDLQNIIEWTLRQLSSSVQKNQTPKDLLAIANADFLDIRKSLWSLGECFKDTYQTLHDAGHLWDAHMLRSGLAQKLTMAAVEDLLTNNDMIQFANEVSFNIALEQILCSSDTDKLQQQYQVVVTMLDRIAQMYIQHKEVELSRLEEFMILPTYMAKTLLSEFYCFLEKYQGASIYISGNYSIQPGMTSPRLTQINALRSPLSRAILQSELQKIALQNWRNGFLESFQSNVSLVPEELRRQAKLWVDERAAALHMRYSLKLVSHSIRLERVRAARDRRLAELNYHEGRLNSHLNAIYDLVDCLLEESSQFLTLDSPNLYPLCQWIDRIHSGLNTLLAQDPLNPETKRLKMCSYAFRLPKYRRLYEESLDSAIEEYKRQLEYRIQEARISNVRFISHIKLFNEGGRYAVQEATRTCNALLKASDALEVGLSRAVDGLHHRRSQLLIMADQRLSPLQKIVEENFKGGGKSVQDKKKRQLARKK